MSHYTNYRKMDIEAAETGPEPIPTSVSHKIINKMEANGVIYFLVQWAESFMGPSWVIQSSEPWLQKLIQEYEGGLPESPQGNMDIQQCDHLKQESNDKPEDETTQGKKEKRRLRPEEYQRLGNSQVKAIVDRFISKIKRAILKLKNTPNKNLYTAVTKIICLHTANQELGLIVQYNGTDFYKFIPYDQMRENHPRQLQVFFGKCLQEYNDMCLGIFAKNYRMHADFLGKLFDNNWTKDSLGLMVKTPKEPIQVRKPGRFDCEAAANIFSVEFQVDRVGNEPGLMMDESEETESRDYEWGV